jgi:hypothetical protein
LTVEVKLLAGGSGDAWSVFSANFAVPIQTLSHKLRASRKGR